MLYVRWWILRSVSWCLRLRPFITPYPVVRTIKTVGGVLNVRYEVHGARNEPCGCEGCRAVRGKQIGTPAVEVLP